MLRLVEAPASALVRVCDTAHVTWKLPGNRSPMALGACMLNHRHHVSVRNVPPGRKPHAHWGPFASPSDCSSAFRLCGSPVVVISGPFSCNVLLVTVTGYAPGIVTTPSGQCSPAKRSPRGGRQSRSRQVGLGTRGHTRSPPPAPVLEVCALTWHQALMGESRQSSFSTVAVSGRCNDILWPKNTSKRRPGPARGPRPASRCWVRRGRDPGGALSMLATHLPLPGPPHSLEARDLGGFHAEADRKLSDGHDLKARYRAGTAVRSERTYLPRGR